MEVKVFFFFFFFAKIKLCFLPLHILLNEGLEESSEMNLSEVAWLEEVQPSDNFVVFRGRYNGPVIRV